MVSTPLDKWVKNRKFEQPVTFVQVGSNDGVSAGGILGVSSDPLYPYVKEKGWEGIFIEPVQYMFERLQNTYNDTPGLRFLNIAISNEFTEREIWRVKEDALPHLPWFADKISTFHKSIIYDELAQSVDVDSILVSDRVSCVPLWHVFETYLPNEKIDLLQIDAEVHDAIILKSSNIPVYRPEFVMLEHKHLKKTEIEEVVALLDYAGYSIEFGENDIFASTVQ